MRFPWYAVLLLSVPISAGMASAIETPAVMPATGVGPEAIAPPGPSGAQGGGALDGVITLEDAVTATMQRNPGIAAAALEVSARRGARMQAALLPNPRLIGELEEFGGTGDLSETGAMTTRLGISQEILLGGKYGARIEEAERAVTLARLESEQTVLDVRFEVERRFLDIYVLQERLKLSEENLVLIQQSHDAVLKRVQAGEAAPPDQWKSEVELASARIRLGQVRRDFNVARNALAANWSDDKAAFFGVTGVYADDAPIDASEMLLRLERTPAFRILAQRVLLSEAMLAQEKAAAWPDLELGGGVDWFNETNDRAFFLELSFSLPVFDRNQGGVAEKHAALEKSRRETEAGVLAMRQKLVEALERYHSVLDAFKIMEQTVLPAATISHEAMQKAYWAGEVDFLVLLDAQRTLLEARDARLDLREELERNRIDVRSLAGMPFVVASDDANHGAEEIGAER